MGNNEPKNTSNELNNAKESNDRVKENILIPQNSTHFLCRLEPFKKIESYLSNISKSILKIEIDTRSGKIIGAGFLLKFYIGQELFYCLISNEHVIKDDIIKNNSIINIIYYDNESKKGNIKLKNKKRYIKSFIDIGLDITVIEILDEDNISKNYFLFPESEIMINKRLINNGIYILQYAKGKGLVKSRGKIKEINKYEITHLASTQKGSSGSPIFLENCINIIGIHKEGNKDKTENYGDFIYPVINIIENDINKKRNSGKYINGEYIWEDDKYYIGEFKNNLPNGKGIKYYSNRKILYEGNFINGKFEGNGKYIYDDSDYYIGQYKNGLPNGKGIDYYSNGMIKYEGDYINGKGEGYGKYIWENGDYYIGQWKNGLFNGKGTYYNSNEKINYEVDFINGTLEGNGKYTWGDGKFYIGEFKNNLPNGKGIKYYSNGKIRYEGDFINNKFEGNGKYIWENGEYYIGQYKNGLPIGEGILYYSNGAIKKKGNLMMNLPEIKN